ncbi:MAG: hypothetical protein WBC57_15930, partial [Candidatus Acidiferrales bacterium]
RDLRQLLWHRHRLVQMRTRIMNQLQALAMNEGRRRRYLHLALRRQRNIAKVAMARRLGVRLYWMWRKGWEYAEWVKFGSHAGQLGIGNGV